MGKAPIKTTMQDPRNLVSLALAGERLALARLLSQVENNTSHGKAALSALFLYTGKAHLVGVTGAPGTGKSSLVNKLAYHYRHPPEGIPARKVAIVAVDPSSPFTGGAILGDRVRMQDLAGDEGVFIRSMAARGSLGGLARTTASLVQVFDAIGYEIIFIETVGAGQAEVEVAHLAHTTIVVEAPGLGDDIQAIKAGILEVADLLVVNKADLPGVENTERALRNMLQLSQPVAHVFKPSSFLLATPQSSSDHLPSPDWVPPIIRTVATEGSGVTELAQAIANHHEHLLTSGEWQQRERTRLQAELDTLLQENLIARWEATISATRYQEMIDYLVARKVSPHQAVAALLDGGQPA